MEVQEHTELQEHTTIDTRGRRWRLRSRWHTFVDRRGMAGARLELWVHEKSLREYTPKSAPRPPKSAVAKVWGEEKYFLVCANRGGQAAESSALKYYADMGNNATCIERVSVLKGLRRRGLGRCVVAVMLSRCPWHLVPTQGHPKLVIVDPPPGWLVKFFISCGFEKLSSVHPHVLCHGEKDPCDSHVLVFGS